MRFPIAITASALLTPLDRAGQTTWEAIRAGRTCAEDPSVDSGLLDEAEGEMDRAGRLALTVGGRALAGAGLSARERGEIPLFVGTSKGPMLSLLAGADEVRRGAGLGAFLAGQVALGPEALACELQRGLGLRGMAHTSVAACASGLHALHRAVRALQHGEIAAALVVAADASLHPLFAASFERLGVLATPNADGVRRCYPFDAQRHGFFLAESAAALVLQREGPKEAAGPRCFVEESWIGSDSTHLIAGDPACGTLRYGLRRLGGDEIDFVHAHAPGTAHDQHERAAIVATCPKARIFSHKHWLGHSLGAAGLTAAVLSVECHRRGVTLNGAKVPTGGRSLTIAQGFGGHIGVVGLRGE